MPSPGRRSSRASDSLAHLSKEARQIVNAARTLGSLWLDDTQLMRLCTIIAADQGRPDLVEDAATAHPRRTYYETPLDWFDQGTEPSVSLGDLLARLSQAIPDFWTYLKGLCEIHKRRVKFQLILENQPLPQLAQVVPRSLLEFGARPSEALASWLVWRKWLYDIDNRSAQETGYLFEPILAAAIGGVPYSARNSPVRRADDPRRGRQVDCLDGQFAYEFKMRVTIAASGQGRFREELDFASDCHASGYIPMLVVLDPTPSARLIDLTAAYRRYGGDALVGDDAWEHLEQRAGATMGAFIERYVRAPLREIAAVHTDLRPINLALTAESIRVEIGDDAILIPRDGGTLPARELEALFNEQADEE